MGSLFFDFFEIGKAGDARGIQLQIDEIRFAMSIVSRIEVMRRVQRDFDHAHPHDDWQIEEQWHFWNMRESLFNHAVALHLKFWILCA